jgi:hypothetical protein
VDDARLKETKMKRPLTRALAIAWWYLLYPPAAHKGDPDSQASLSKWNIDGSYGAEADYLTTTI